MSSQRNDSIFNSSDEGESIHEGESIQPSSASPGPGVNIGNNVGEYVTEASPDRHQMQLGVDLGRRLARLELGNELNKQQLDNVNQKVHTYEEAFIMENARVGDLEGKVISMEARLLSEEKLGLDVKERISKLEDKLRKKDEEISELKDMLVNSKTELAKENGKFDKLERENVELKSQFVTLLDTCQTFNDELQSLKKMNFEIKRQLKNEESPSSATVKQIINAPISQLNPLFQNPSTTVPTSSVSPDFQSDPATVPTSCVIPGPPTYPTRVVNNSLSNNAKVRTPTPTIGSQKNTTATKVDCVPLPSHPSSYLSQELVNQCYNPSSQELVNQRYNPMSQELVNQCYNPDLYNSAPAGPVYFSEVTEPTGLLFYHPEADAYMTLHCGSAPQSDGIEVNQDFSAYYCQR